MPDDGLLKKGAILEEIHNLKRAKERILAELRELDAKYIGLKERYQPEIDRLSRSADALAVVFRQKYEGASEAYAAGEKALAKTLSEEGHAIQGECEVLNREANRMRGELDSILKNAREKKRELNLIRARLDVYQKTLTSFKRPRLEGFPKNRQEDLALEKLLDQLPQNVLQGIEKITFVSETPIGEDGEGRLGDTRWNLKTKRASVRVYQHIAERGQLLEETVMHEISHEIFLKYMTNQEKREWEELYLDSGDRFVSLRAIRSYEEDFCECFAKFFLDPPFLERRNNWKYALIDRIVKRLEEKQL